MEKVIIICYSYSDGFAYHEQKIATAFVKMGYSVLLLCSTACRVSSDKVVRVKKSQYLVKEGYSVCRLPFITGAHVPHSVVPIILDGMYKKIDEFQPDIIYHMGISSINLLSVFEYKKKHENTLLVVDNHASFQNSASNWLSRNILHKLIYRTIIDNNLSLVDQFFYVGNEEKRFMSELYGIPNNKMSFFPLTDFCYDNNEYYAVRNEIRDKLNVASSDILICHSGKFTKEKKTIELLRVMSEICATFQQVKFFLIGEVQDPSILEEYNQIKKEQRKGLFFLGWKSSGELKRYLCGMDIYVQYCVSSTFQTALCCRCVAITNNNNGTYRQYENAPFLEFDTFEELKEQLLTLIIKKERILELKKLSNEFAINNLDCIQVLKSKLLPLEKRN